MSQRLLAINEISCTSNKMYGDLTCVFTGHEEMQETVRGVEEVSANGNFIFDSDGGYARFDIPNTCTIERNTINCSKD